MDCQAHSIDGKKIADSILSDVKQRVAKLAAKPGLAIILVGTDPASYIYVGLKEKASQFAGIAFEKYVLPESTGEQKILDKISELNGRTDINGILVQLPLPKGYVADKVVGAIDPMKDVDGFHPANLQALQQGRPGLVPGLAAGIVELVKSTGVRLPGKRAVIISNSQVFCQPIVFLLAGLGCAVEQVGSRDAGLAEKTSSADVIIVAIGRPKFVKKEMVKSGAIIIDVGYNRLNGKAVGDVDFSRVCESAGWVTPVPGGVGPMTVAMLLHNVLHAYELQRR
ncbi:MAG: bifunctional 5,10-methylenetetrahydrofolate dehydrogenase/5,10-methenyltetrahydrofolate cyclohydrolase [Patescibacteria group bacterium]